MKKKVFTILIFLFFLTNVSAQIEVHSSNQVGIGTATPQYKLHVVGDAFITGNVIGHFYLRSDSNFLGTTGNYPVIFKVNNILSGSTGNPDNMNVSFGYGSLLNPGATNTNNTAMGYGALRNSTDGIGYNTAIGAYTLHSNTTGSYNTAMGNEALRSNSEGSNNIANGHHALYNNTTGNNNVAIGSDVLYNNTTGSYNTAIGISAGAGFRESDVINNSIAIGYQAPVTASNQVRIGNSTVTSIGGSVSWSNLSDGRAAKNIRSDVPGLAFVNSLQPVTYNMDLDAMDELMSGGKKSLAQMQVGETIGGNRIIFDTSKDLGERRYMMSSFIINGENEWKIQFSYSYSARDYTHYLSIQLINPSNEVVETIYSSNTRNGRFTWEWHKSEILVPVAFGKITSFVENRIGGPPFFGGYAWDLDDAWVAPPGSQALDDIQQQARENKEAQVQTGFVAQDVETAAQSAGFDFSGVDVDEKTGAYSLRYAEFVVPLVKAVQELSEQNDRLREQIDELKNRIETLENR